MDNCNRKIRSYDATGQITDILTSIKGPHQIRLGGEYRRNDLNLAYFSGKRGTFVSSGSEGPWATNATASDLTADPNTLIITDFLAGYLFKGSITRGDQQRNIFTNSFSGFLQVAWLGTSRKDQIYGPGYQAVGFSVFKTGTIHDTVKVQFRAEFFNLFNHFNFAPALNVADGQSLGLSHDTIGDYNGASGIGSGEPFNTRLAPKILF